MDYKVIRALLYRDAGDVKGFLISPLFVQDVPKLRWASRACGLSAMMWRLRVSSSLQMLVCRHVSIPSTTITTAATTRAPFCHKLDRRRTPCVATPMTTDHDTDASQILKTISDKRILHIAVIDKA